MNTIQIALTILALSLIYQQGESITLSDIYTYYKYLINKQDAFGDKPLSTNIFPFVNKTFIRASFIGQSDNNENPIKFEQRPNTSTKILNICFNSKYPGFIIAELKKQENFSAERVSRLAYLHACLIYDLRQFFRRDPLIALFPALKTTSDEQLLETIRTYEATSGRNTTVKTPQFKPTFDEYQQSQQDSFYSEQRFRKTTSNLNEEIDESTLSDSEEEEDEESDFKDEQQKRESLGYEIRERLVNVEKKGTKNKRLISDARNCINNTDSCSTDQLKSVAGRLNMSISKMESIDRKKREQRGSKKNKN